MQPAPRGHRPCTWGRAVCRPDVALRLRPSLETRGWSREPPPVVLSLIMPGVRPCAAPCKQMRLTRDGRPPRVGTLVKTKATPPRRPPRRRGYRRARGSSVDRQTAPVTSC